MSLALFKKELIEIESRVIGDIIQFADLRNDIMAMIGAFDFVDETNTRIAKLIYTMEKKKMIISKDAIISAINATDKLTSKQVSETKARVYSMCSVASKANFESDVERYIESRDRYNTFNAIEERKKELLNLELPYADATSMLKDSLDFTGSMGLDVAKVSSNIEKVEYEVLRTGIPKIDFDLYQNNLKRGTHHLITARSGHGKTFFSFMLEAGFIKSGYKGLHFHLEDSLYNAKKRLLAHFDASNYHLADNLFLIDEEYYISRICSIIRYYHKKYDIDFFVVDHLSKVRSMSLKAHQKYELEIEASDSLRKLAKELELLSILITQPNKPEKDHLSLNRNSWARLMGEGDMKGASEVYEDAFSVMTVFRPNQFDDLVYNYEPGLTKHILLADKEVANRQHYDSVFVKTIKMREGRKTNKGLHLIQDNLKLVTKDEFYANLGEEVKINI